MTDERGPLAAFGHSRAGRVPQTSPSPPFVCLDGQSQEGDRGGFSAAVEATDKISHRKCVCMCQCGVCEWGLCATMEVEENSQPRGVQTRGGVTDRAWSVPAGREFLCRIEALGVPGTLDGLSHVVSVRVQGKKNNGISRVRAVSFY